MLMFQRLAANYIKRGYYPTDSETTECIISALAPSNSGVMRIIDPTCGEGVILAELKHHLNPENTIAYGVEYDEERAWHAKSLLDTAIHADLQDCIIGYRQFSMMLLNPPYGDLVSDHGQLGSLDAGKGRKRMEKLFYSKSIGSLMFGGVLALIVPSYSLDSELSGWLSRHLAEVRVFKAPEQQFKQVVVLGYKRRSDLGDRNVREMLEAVGCGEVDAPEFPATWPYPQYTVPAAPAGEPDFRTSHVDPRQLASELNGRSTLWNQFGLHFAGVARQARRPLRALSSWHLGLVLAAGQVSGVVRSDDGRVLVVKGGTHKSKRWATMAKEGDKGQRIEERIATDIFVPSIYALDFTPTSETYGAVLTIR